MMHNVLAIVGSPANRTGNSEAIADCLINKLNSKNQSCSKMLLRNEIQKQEGIVEQIEDSDIIILSFPVYENSVPGLVLKLFEILNKNKDKLSDKPRKMLAISNSGFPEPEANNCAITCCRLFAREVGFDWLGGFGVSPGTLIDGKKLEEAGSTYKKLINLLDIIAENIDSNETIPEKAFELVSKPLISPFIYRFIGNFIQKGIVRKIGKDKYYAKPLI